MVDGSQRSAARVAAIAYLLALIAMVVSFRLYLPLLAWNDLAATAQNIAAHEPAFRLYLAGALAYGVGVVVVLTALYVVLRPVSQAVALFAALCRFIYAVMWFVQLLSSFAALDTARGSGYLSVIGREQLQAMAASHLAAGWNAYYVGLGFYGLGTLAFACLWLKSRYVPRALAVWGVASSVFIGFCGFAYLLFPSFGGIVSVDWYEGPTALFELGLSVWLLAKGLRLPSPATA